MRRQIATLTLAAAALTATTTLAPSAQAQGTPTYTCNGVWLDWFIPDQGFGRGCEASNGAPTAGDIHGTFIIKPSGSGDPTLTCRKDGDGPSGSAKHYPDLVTGYSCR